MVHVYDKSGLALSFLGDQITLEIEEFLKTDPNYKYLISTYEYFPPPHLHFENGDLSLRSYDQLISLGFVNPDQNPYPELPYWIYNQNSQRWEIDQNLYDKYKEENP